MPDPSHAPASSPDEIYVGYLPVPPRYMAFLRWIIPTTLVLLAGAGVLWARSQHSPGRGTWNSSQTLHLQGVMVSKPYRMLLTRNSYDEPELVLLVEKGKHGPRRAAPFDGQIVTITGSPLHRDERRMLELDAADSAITPDPTGARPDPAQVPVRRTMGRVTLRGEIIDPKCFLGAMKPGEGKTHKECATLCIRGGIPPMFITRDEHDGITYYLLEGPDRSAADAGIQPFIADPVEITGDLTTWAGVNLLSLSPADIRRL